MMIILKETETFLIVTCPICDQIFKVKHENYVEPFPHDNCVKRKNNYHKGHKFKKGHKIGYKHGHAGKRGSSKERTREYKSWEAFSRVGRDRRWSNYLTFLEDLGHRPSSNFGARRIDTTKVHSVRNTIWSTANVNTPATSSLWTTKSIEIIEENNPGISLENYVSHEKLLKS